MASKLDELFSGNAPSDMAARGKIGGYARAALHSPEELTGKARAGFMRRFETEVDPERTLSHEERQRRAQAALRAHMARLARLSAIKRRGKGRNSPTQKEPLMGQIETTGTQLVEGTAPVVLASHSTS